MTLSCTTKTVGPSIADPSPLPEGPVGRIAPPPQPSGSPASAVVPVHTPPTLPPPPRRETVISPATTTQVTQPPSTTVPPTTHPPVSTSIDYGPARIDTIQASFVEEWRDLVSVWFRSSDVDRVLAIIECESSGRWNAIGPEVKHLDMVALGLMQHLDGYWLERAVKAEAAGYHNHGDIWSPSDQMAVSAYLAYNTPQGFSHWVCDQGAGQ